MLDIEIAYANSHEHVVIPLQVAVGTTVLQAIIQSKILIQFPEINLQQQAVGIFSNKVSLESIIKAGDRIEIYRPLQCDPKQRRRRKANTKRA